MYMWFLLACFQKKLMQNNSLMNAGPRVESDQLEWDLMTELWTHNGELFTGVRISYWHHGPLEVECGIVNGVEHGECIQYYSDGRRIHVYRIYNNGKLDGVHTTWYPENVKDTEEHYSDGVLNGPYTKWIGGRAHPKIVSGQYVDGNKDGVWLYYSETNGNYLSRKVEYDMDSIIKETCYDGEGTAIDC